MVKSDMPNIIKNQEKKRDEKKTLDKSTKKSF